MVLTTKSQASFKELAFKNLSYSILTKLYKIPFTQYFQLDSFSLSADIYEVTWTIRNVSVTSYGVIQQ